MTYLKKPSDPITFFELPGTSKQGDVEAPNGGDGEINMEFI